MADLNFLKGATKIFQQRQLLFQLKNFFKIDQPERDAIVEALRRIGVISYRTPDGKTTLFEIDERMLGDKVIIDPAR